jgi:hypothetical protein
MAIRPEDVKQAKGAKLTAARKKQLEREADSMLKETFGYLSTSAFSVKGLSKAEIDYLKETYSAAGWTVTYVDDWRDGDYLDFKPKR